jgi:hypothetical protein
MSADPGNKPETYRQWFERFRENPTGVDNGAILMVAGSLSQAWPVQSRYGCQSS